MPRKSQASLACLKNLQKSYKATVEDVPDSDGEESDYFPGDDKKESWNCQQNDGPCLEDFFLVLEEEGLACDSSESDSELVSESDMDLDGEAEIWDEAVLLHFTSTLQKAQEVAVAAERKAWKMKRRPKHYNGHSARTLYRQAAKHRKITVDGKQPFIQAFFRPKADNNTPVEIDPESDNDDDSSDSDSTCKVSVMCLKDEKKLTRNVKSSPTSLQPTLNQEAHHVTGPSLPFPDRNSPAITDEHQKEVERLLECLQRGEKPRDESPDDISDSALNWLSMKNFPELR